MATRFVERFNSLGEIESLPSAAGIGVVDGVPYVNTGGGAAVLSADVSKGKRYYVAPQDANADDVSNSGRSWSEPFASMSPLEDVLTHGDTVFLAGVLKQNWTSPPAVQDVTIVGVANTPRQATSGGVPGGGGATWMNPGTVASPLLHLGNTSTTKDVQAWRLVNIFFGQAGAAACVKLSRKITGADPSHASFIGCKFSGADDGIQNVEGSFILVDDCEFFNFTTAGKGGIQSIAGDGVALPLQCIIRNSKFWNNVRHIKGAFSSAEIINNLFSWKGSSLTTTVQIDLSGGKNNNVMLNRFTLAESAGTGTMFQGGTDDSWFNYYAEGAVAGVPI